VCLRIIKQISIPLPVYILRKLWQNIILFGHNLIIIFLVISFVGQGWSWNALYAIPAFILVLILLFSVSLILSIACARFMDITQVVSVFLQLVYFITPVFWMKKLLPENYAWITEFNPFYHAIEIIRAPLLGGQYPTNSMLWLIFYTCVFTLIAIGVFKRFKQRVAYWV
jgi:ABC-type polysaccharide/polyol phosphate export permease